MTEAAEISALKPIRDIVYENLRTSILEGKLRPGQRLVEIDYANKYNISRTPIREAIRKLEIEGFVEYIPRKGVIVKTFEVADIIEIYAIRTALETLAMQFTIKNINDKEIANLRVLVDKMEFTGESRDIPELINNCREFNEVLLRTSKLPRLIGIISTLQDYLERFREITLANDVRRSSAINEHKKILQAIIERDEPKAVQLTVEHLEAAKVSLLKNLGIKC